MVGNYVGIGKRETEFQGVSSENTTRKKNNHILRLFWCTADFRKEGRKKRILNLNLTPLCRES